MEICPIKAALRGVADGDAQNWWTRLLEFHPLMLSPLQLQGL